MRRKETISALEALRDALYKSTTTTTTTTATTIGMNDTDVAMHSFWECAKVWECIIEDYRKLSFSAMSCRRCGVYHYTGDIKGCIPLKLLVHK